MNKRIGLVAAPKRRRGAICRAREQYDPSPVFRRARDHCDREYGEWYVVCTSRGLLAPHRVIGADAPALHAMPVAERWRWADGVAAQLCERQERSAEPLTFVLYASQQYADLLLRAAPFADFELPLAGLSLGGRVRWYDERLRTPARMLARALSPLSQEPERQ